jgi:hypothetical protein
MGRTRSNVIRQRYVEKMQVGSDQCMAGNWPQSAKKGKSYAENGYMVTPECSGVSGLLNFSGRFFHQDDL